VTLADQSAIALLEFGSIAFGVRAGDAMVKRAPVDLAYAGTVHPGHYLILVAGDVACVDEAFQAGLENGTESLLDQLFLPAVHPNVVQALLGRRRPSSGEALGMVETRTVAATIGAADCGLKGAEVSLLEIRLADRIGGKGYCAFSGPLAEVEAAVEAAVDRLASPETLIADVVIPQFHEEMLANIEAGSEFWTRINQEEV
jgi:microcompartment protein CcmL/EutN